jgi:hydroxymethylpyrimidine/phosphomethylpyrimidine kinase
VIDGFTMLPLALTVAGSDPSGGAGLQADLKTFHQHGAYGMAVVTLITVQSTRGVQRVEVLPAELVGEQLTYLLADLTPHAAKTGALGSAAVVEAVASRLVGVRFPVVVDPVMVSKHGHRLLDEAAATALRQRLLPLTTLLTPNTHEAAALWGRPVETLAQARDAARALAAAGPRAVLVKGGHLEGAPVDVLWDGSALHELAGERLSSAHTHGTGCTLSAAITAQLARGKTLLDATRAAKAFVTEAIRTAPAVGGGVGPVNHFAATARD